MAGSPLENVVSHWSKLVEGFQASPKDFYAAVEAALEQRKVPGLKTSRIDWNEGGVISPKREYLRVSGGRFSFDVCAAPFGTGFFFSSWLIKRPARMVLLFFLAFLIVGGIIFFVLQKGSMMEPFRGLWQMASFLSLYISIAILFLAFMVDFWLVALFARLGWDDPEAALMAIPLVGWFYEQFFAPQTYYKLDTTGMFRAAVHAAVLECVDGLMASKGLKSLTEDERKPVFQKLL